MKRLGLWIEFVIVMVIGVVAIFEALRLIFYKDPKVLYDILGPGFYVLFLGSAFMVAGIAYLVVHLKQPIIAAKEASDKMSKFRLYGSFAALVIYFILMDILGYLMATFIFFLLEFWILGIKSWAFNVILSVIVTVAYYTVFVKYCNIVFPRGFLF